MTGIVVGERLRTARKAAGLSQQRLADVVTTNGPLVNRRAAWIS